MGERNSALDGLRGVAAIGVFLTHVQLVRYKPGFFEHGYLAVDLFFLLSGYVIGAAYERRFGEGMGPVAYMRIRLNRLYPMIALGAVLGLCSVAMRPIDFSLSLAFFSQLAFIPFAVAKDDAFPLNNVQWSLWFELFINLVHVLVWRHLTTTWLAVVAAVSAVTLAVIGWHYGHLNVGYSADTFVPGLVRVTALFSLGLLIFRLRDRLPRIPSPYLLTLAICGVVLVAPRLVPDAAVALVIWPVVLIAASQAKPTGWARRGSEVGGAISYPLYAIHMPLLMAAATIINMSSTTVIRAAGWVFMLVTVPCLAWAVSRWVERPVMAWSRA
jgi:peptidoglycan/LPS O-acetylase OafA/YrhL